MASLEKRGKKYRLIFCVQGQRHHVSLKTSKPDQAEKFLKRLEANLADVLAGSLVIPPEAEVGTFLLSNGKATVQPTITRSVPLSEFFATYQASQRTKEPNTLYTEDIHIAHLKRHLGSRPVKSLKVADLQAYLGARLAEAQSTGKTLSSETLRKEIGTFTSVWNKWGIPVGQVTQAAPTAGLNFGKDKAKPPFQTWQEIERQVTRENLGEDEHKRLWDCLFLSLDQIRELLHSVSERAKWPFVYPFFVFAAHTGARRSEILRSRVDDFNFETGEVRIREKKRDTSKEFTFRHVPITPLLTQVMSAWFKDHPGGASTICEAGGSSLTPQMTAHHFRYAVNGTKWEVLRGWHVLRHSFISNLAAKGVDQRVIDSFVGHTTEEMRTRYTHLFPDQKRKALHAVFAE